MVASFASERRSRPRKPGRSTHLARGGWCKWDGYTCCEGVTVAIWIDTLTPSDARNILRPLRKGSAPAEHARDLFVGQTPWFKTAVQMMRHTAEDAAFEVRFVRAAYGGGKTLFLRCLEQEAQAAGWVTAFVIL